MKEDINLLPPLEIKTRRRRLILQHLGHILRIGIIAAYIPLLVLGGVYGVSIFAGRLTGQGNSLSPGDEEQELRTRIRAANTLVGAINQWVQTHHPVTPLTPDLLRVVPIGVTLTELKLEKETRAFMIEGIGISREAMVLYRRQLEALPWVARVDAPLSNFATGIQNDFTFTVWRKEAAALPTP